MTRISIVSSWLCSTGVAVISSYCILTHHQNTPVEQKKAAAVEHVLTKVAMKAQSRDIYRAYVLENRPIEGVVKTFGVSADIIYKVKNRVNKMIEAVEEEYAEEK